MGIENSQGDSPSENINLGEIDKHISETSETMKEAKVVLAEITSMLTDTREELDAVVTGNKYAKEEDLKPMASEERIAELRKRIDDLLQQQEEVEAVQAETIRAHDTLAAQEQELMKLILKHPTREKNPDDNQS